MGCISIPEFSTQECKDKTGNCEGFHYFDAKKHNMLDRPGTRATKYHQLGLEGWLLKVCASFFVLLEFFMCFLREARSLLDTPPWRDVWQAYHALGVVCTMGVKGLGYCGHHMGPLVDSMGRISPSWPSLKEILSDTEMKALFEWQPPKEEAPKRQSELQDWVSTPGHGESMTADFVKKRPAKRIDYRRSRVRTKFVGRPQQRTRWGLPLRHRHASKVESNGPAEVIGDADIQ